MTDVPDTGTAQAKHRSQSGLNAIFAPRQLARMAVLIALSAVGALIKIPSPTGTVALDSTPGFFAGAAFGSIPGVIVGAIGHLLSAATTGFPLGPPIHLLIALVVMPVSVAAFGFLARKTFLILAAIVAIWLNAVAGVAVVIPFIGVGAAIAYLIPLLVGATINVVIAGVAYKLLERGGLLGVRRSGFDDE